MHPASDGGSGGNKNSVAFNTTTNNSSGSTEVAQVDNVTISGSAGTGDKFMITIGSSTLSYNVAAGDGIRDVRDALLAAINADDGASALVQASAGSGSGDMTLTAVSAGAGFTASAVTSNAGK